MLFAVYWRAIALVFVCCCALRYRRVPGDMCSGGDEGLLKTVNKPCKELEEEAGYGYGGADISGVCACDKCMRAHMRVCAFVCMCDIVYMCLVHMHACVHISSSHCLEGGRGGQG